MRAALVALVLVALAPAAASAGDQRWGMAIWGVSYHTNRDADYEEKNWGLGLRYYARPNRFFVQADALRNSNRGLALPLSAGVEFRLIPLPRGCKISGEAALTVAYYQYPDQNRSEIKVGPVPGASIGCGRLRATTLVVFRKSSSPVAALSVFMTVGF